MSGIPQQPYFLRALYEWCVDSGYTPYLTVKVDDKTKVPSAYVKDGQIVLNIGPNAVRQMKMDNEWIVFSARFGGQAHTIQVPVSGVISIYARETGEGMAFQATDVVPAEPVLIEQESGQDSDETPPDPDKPRGGRPNLRVVK